MQEKEAFIADMREQLRKEEYNRKMRAVLVMGIGTALVLGAGLIWLVRF